MFLAIAGIVVLLSLRYADWKNWRAYNATMIFFSLGNLFYNFVYHDHFLWKFVPDEFNHHIIEIIYFFTVYPLTALIFLSRMPSRIAAKLFRTLMFISIYALTELLLHIMGKITYDFAWSYGLSVLWNIMTFPMLALHHKRPGIAYFLCLMLVFLMAWLFPYNLH